MSFFISTKRDLANNQDRIAKAEQRGTLPYFVRDNREMLGLAKTTNSGGMKGGKHLGCKEEKEAYIAYSRKGNSVTTLTKEQIANRNELAELLGIPKEEILPFMEHQEANKRFANIDYGKNESFFNNCQSCVVAYEARRRGLDVTALGYDYNTNSPSYRLSEDCSLSFKNANVQIITEKKTIKHENDKQCYKRAREIFFRLG